MDSLPPSIRKLARRLLSTNAAGVDPSAPEGLQVNEKLRLALIQLVGTDGFASLLRRALALAAAEMPALQIGKVSDEGNLEGLEQLSAREGNAGREAAVAITVQLLGLLVHFIGEGLTQRLVRQVWPEISPDEREEERG